MKRNQKSNMYSRVTNTEGENAFTIHIGGFLCILYFAYIDISISKARAAIEAFLSESSSVEKPPQARQNTEFQILKEVSPKLASSQTMCLVSSNPFHVSFFFVESARLVPTTFSLVRSSTCAILSPKKPSTCSTSKKDFISSDGVSESLSYHSSTNF